MASRWYKVINDLKSNKMRTVLIVLSIAVGLFAIGTILTARTVLSTEMDRSFATIAPSTGTVRTVELFDEAFVQSVRAMPDVIEADARRVYYVRVQTGPDEWVNLIVFAIEDYENVRVNKIFPQKGAWPPPEREILIERAALALINAHIGDDLVVETPAEKRIKMRVAGTVHDMAQMPAQFDNSPYAYVSFDTLRWLGEPYGFNELYIISRNADDKDFAQDVLNRVKNKVEKNGMTIPIGTTAEPGQLPFDDILQALLLLMGVLGMLALFLSAFLIVNTISALLAQQRRQVGVMKALGASTSQIVGMYLAMVTFYGLAALLFSIPLGVLGSKALSNSLAAMFNFDIRQFRLPAAVIGLQMIAGLVLPVMSSLYPLLTSVRITAAEAMSSYTLGKGRFGAGLIDRSLSGANLWIARNVLPRPYLLSLRNIFRSKGRLALTLATLTLASAIFVGVFSVRVSLNRSIDALMRVYNFDIFLYLRRSYRVEKIIQEALQVPGVTRADVWIQVPARRVRLDGSQGKTIYMLAPRVGSDLIIGPEIVQGRWLLPEDENAIVVDAIFLKDEPDVQVGDEILLKINGREKKFKVVGFSLGVVIPIAYGNYPYVSGLAGSFSKADIALIATHGNDSTTLSTVTRELEARFERAGMQVDNVFTSASEREEAQSIFGAITSLLLFMAVLLAVVGGVGLMGTMSINVLERTREIGVLRAIGAPNQGVSQVFILEGVAIGFLSWAIGSLLAFPLGKLLCDAVGSLLMGVPVRFYYSLPGFWLWLGLVILLSALASYLPARNASRLTVRETLAYE